MVIGRSRHASSAFATVTTLFFSWGFITALVDPLVAAVKGIFTLSDLQAQASAFAFFFAYFVVSFPAAAVVSRLKAVHSILAALVMMILGCLIMLTAANLAIYWLVLLGLFALASGITVLQVAANPLAAALGDPAKSHFRLVVSQTFNSLGTFLAPLLGAHLFLAGVEVKRDSSITMETRAQALAGITTAYVWICALIAALALFFWLSRRVVAEAAPLSRSTVGLFSALRSRWAIAGAIAIFLYVGAEVSIGTQMALFLNSDAVWGRSDAPFHVPLLGWLMGSDGVPGVSLQEAGKAVAFYWGGAMVGRALGSLLLTKIRAHLLLACNTLLAAGMCLYVVTFGGVGGGFVALAIGFLNSIMFPVIFSLTLERTSASTESTSGLLCTAIVGGALMPLLVGLLSDTHGYGFALIVPALCYAILCAFAICAGQARVVRVAGGSRAVH
ncbi:MFS transporter [Sphingomonas sp. BIUV-7]|uniref:MFS transporter n=1 Tax=Sphingomonas natans TaxID=3063330 RepID=A0ABT8Y6U6_9SPHN|nr:MFS transporter [Sphingomonas sp. BIUV-7]MDO6414040.1 MFS transporter [Sphingomonas sp. BIUV-7]